MSKATWCWACGGVMRLEVVHDATPPAHSDGNYVELRWVCPKCGRITTGLTRT